MQAVHRIFICALAFCASLGAALGVFLYISIIPYFDIIGKVAAGLVITGLVCVASILVTFTWTKIGIFFARLKKERLHANLLVSGEVVVLLRPNGQYEHLSALHEAARHPARIVEAATATGNDDDEPGADDNTIMELWSQGNSLRDIARDTNTTFYHVQKTVAKNK